MRAFSIVAVVVGVAMRFHEVSIEILTTTGITKDRTVPRHLLVL